MLQNVQQLLPLREDSSSQCSKKTPDGSEEEEDMWQRRWKHDKTCEESLSDPVWMPPRSQKLFVSCAEEFYSQPLGL